MIRNSILVFVLTVLQASCASTTLPDAANTAPVANAGNDSTSTVGETVVIDASSSYDPDGNELLFRWRLIAPEGSKANLSSTNFVETEFTPDVEGDFTIELVVSDGALDSPPDSVKISVTGFSNSRPEAAIAPVGVARVGEAFELDGTPSSDADGDVLTYDWLIEGGPEESVAALSDPITPKTLFFPDVVGEFEISLVVSDGVSRSQPVAVFVEVVSGGNLPPVADPGSHREVAPGSVVMLDGSLSTDPENATISFSWSMLERPADSVASMSAQDIVNPSFTADALGTYRIQLVVSDGELASVPVVLLVDAKEGNLAPTANAGPDQEVAVGSLVTLDAADSVDANSDSMSYRWSFLNRPTGSTATFSNATAARPTFTTDVAGDYLVQLIANDGTVDSAPDTVMVSCVSNNVAPVANAGLDINGNIGVTITLDGRSSSDANNDTLTYSWTLTTRPGSSSATLLNDDTARPTFVPDSAGTFIVTLIVNDGLLDSAPNTVQVNVGSSFPAAEGDLVVTEIMINPATLADSAGEYVELYNPTNNDWQLEGCVLSDLGTDDHTINSTVSVPAQTYVVFAASSSVSAADYIWSGFQLSNSGDEVILTCNGTEISNLAYGSSFDSNGAAKELLTSKYDETSNDSATNWCLSSTSIPGGDFGTPGGINAFATACP